MTPLLSICICSIVGREAMLDNLLLVLKRQIDKCDARQLINVFVEKDNRELTIGEKRNCLINSATGEYTCFIDDDDMVADNYIEHIISAAKKGCDCVGIRGIISSDRPTTISGKIFEHSLDCRGWYEGANGILYRTPNHLNPIKTEIVKSTMFNPSLNGGEDKDYSTRILKSLKTESFIEDIIYIYRIFTRTERTW